MKIPSPILVGIGCILAAALLGHCSVSYALDCDQVHREALELGKARQGGKSILAYQAQATGMLRLDMMTNVYQWPGMKGKEEQDKRANLFAATWYRACKSGIYPN